MGRGHVDVGSDFGRGVEMTEHKHSGTESYATNPGKVDSASGPAPEKDEHAPDPETKRNPVVPAVAVPTDEKKRPLGSFGYGG